MKRTLLFVGIVCICFAGCATNKMYYFGDYSKTLYSYEKNQNEESLVKHKQELESVIAKSEKKNLPVPPGIYAELGYINLKANDEKEAIKLFKTEAQLYPESIVLMTRLIQSAETKKETQDTSEKGNEVVK